MGEATHPGWGMEWGQLEQGTLAAACSGKACEAAEGQRGLITRAASSTLGGAPFLAVRPDALFRGRSMMLGCREPVCR